METLDDKASEYIIKTGKLIKVNTITLHKGIKS